MHLTEKMAQTVALGQKALAHGELPIAAIIFLGDQNIAQAYTCEVSEKRYLVHAELLALLAADQQRPPISQRKQMQLFTTLEPCLMCYGAAMSFFVGEIYYALHAPDGATNLIQFANFDQLPLLQAQNPTFQGGILRDEAQILFVDYMARITTGPLHNFARDVVDYNTPQ